jgi:hypothetical protein
MRYMLLMHGTRAAWRPFDTWAPGDVEAYTAWSQELDRRLGTSGELVSAAGLAGPAQAKLVRARAGAAPTVTAAVLDEDTEFLAACWTVDCDSLERAAAIAAWVSAAPGRGGSPLNAAVQIRPVLRAPGEEM